MHRQINIFTYLLILYVLTLSSCQKPERDNPWDEKNLQHLQAWTPSNLQLDRLTATTYRLSWAYTGDSRIEGFKIDRKKANEQWIEAFAIIPKNSRNWVDEVSEPNLSYSYRIYAYAGNATSNILEMRDKYTESVLGLNLKMLRIDGGSFQMGSNFYSSNEKPVHEVTLRTFYLGQNEVTQAQWRAVMGTDPLYSTGCDNCPVEQVSWEDIQLFLDKLNAASGKNYQLPSEAQWEFAAGGGAFTTRLIYAGTNDENSLANYAWCAANNAQHTYPVGTKWPNSLGLYDMNGNVSEWCEDDWHMNYVGATIDGTAWVDNPQGESRVHRGGSYYQTTYQNNISYRSYWAPNTRWNGLGFRIALVP